MTGRAAAERAADGATFLRKAGQRIVFSEQPNHRGSGSPFSDKRGRNARSSGENAKAILRQQLLEISAGAFFFERGFGKFPYCIVGSIDNCAVFFDLIHDFAANRFFHGDNLPFLLGKSAAPKQFPSADAFRIFHLAVDSFCQRIGWT